MYTKRMKLRYNFRTHTSINIEIALNNKLSEPRSLWLNIRGIGKGPLREIIPAKRNS